MYEPYSEEVLTRKLDDNFAYDGRFVTLRFHVGNNCKCQNNIMHPGHHQVVPEEVPPGDDAEATGFVRGPHKHKHDEESIDLAEARKASHVKHKD